MPQTAQEIALLRAEIEMLMVERKALLRTVGAAAALVATMNSSELPEEAFESAELLAAGLNDLSEETLKDALEIVRVHIEGDAAAGDNQ